MADARLEAIRADVVVGRGSCSTIDECYDDGELAMSLDEAGVFDPARAVEWARRVEGLQMNSMLDQRWGEDDDPQLAIYRDFVKKCEENPL